MYAYVQVKTFFLTTGYLQKSTSTCDNNLYVKMGVNDGGLFTPFGGLFSPLGEFFLLMGAIFSIQGLLSTYGTLFTKGGGHFVCIWGPFSLCALSPLLGGGGAFILLMEVYFEFGPSLKNSICTYAHQSSYYVISRVSIQLLLVNR